MLAYPLLNVSLPLCIFVRKHNLTVKAILVGDHFVSLAFVQPRLALALGPLFCCQQLFYGFVLFWGRRLYYLPFEGIIAEELTGREEIALIGKGKLRGSESSLSFGPAFILLAVDLFAEQHSKRLLLISILYLIQYISHLLSHKNIIIYFLVCINT
jgi:hypothetical protein